MSSCPPDGLLTDERPSGGIGVHEDTGRGEAIRIYKRWD